MTFLTFERLFCGGLDVVATDVLEGTPESAGRRTLPGRPVDEQLETRVARVFQGEPQIKSSLFVKPNIIHHYIPPDYWSYRAMKYIYVYEIYSDNYY